MTTFLHSKKNLLLLFGFVFELVGGILSIFSVGMEQRVGIVMFIVGLSTFVYGCIKYISDKGYNWFLGFIGVFSWLGYTLLYFFPNRRLSNKLIKKKLSTKSFLIIVIFIFPLIVLCIGIGYGLYVASNVMPVDSRFVRQTRDEQRYTDLDKLRNAINKRKSPTEEIATYCNKQQPPCVGYTNSYADLNIRNIDGTGWVMIDLSGEKGLESTKLPTDPLNDQEHYYVYCSDGTGWEINALPEYNVTSGKQETDGGDNIFWYEVGSDLNLCDNGRLNEGGDGEGPVTKWYRENYLKQ